METWKKITKNAQRELEEMERLIRSGAKAVFKPLKLEEEFQPGAEKAEYCRMVEKAKEYIREGDIFQVVLSNPLTAKAKGSLLILTGTADIESVTLYVLLLK